MEDKEEKKKQEYKEVSLALLLLKDCRCGAKDT